MKTRPATTVPTEHPLAAYIRILGKGKTGTRSLGQAEARQAFGMILRGDAQPVQVGAFLMLLRVKEETGAELAGFVEACRDVMQPPPPTLQVDLDWSSYAGKRHQHPWFILSMLLLAGAGYRIFVHGSAGHTPGRLYTEHALASLGLPVAGDWQDVAGQLDADNLSYLPLRRFCPGLEQLIQLRPLLGLRSPVNTLTRMLNPLRAPCSIQSIFHPAYGQLHQDADRLLGQPRSLVFKGDSGEVEVKPQADTRLQLLVGAATRQLLMQRTVDTRVASVDELGVAALRSLWRGDEHNPYGLEAVLATTAAALLLLKPELDIKLARDLAAAMWRDRDIRRLD